VLSTLLPAKKAQLPWQALIARPGLFLGYTVGVSGKGGYGQRVFG